MLDKYIIDLYLFQVGKDRNEILKFGINFINYYKVYVEL